MAQVKLILRESVPSLGEAGDLVSVKPGYARNYLLPQGLALLATETRMREVEHHKRVVAEKVARELKSLGAVRDKLAATPLQISAQAGEGGKLFGSVTSAQIAELLEARGFEIDRRKIVLAEPIKSLGEHKVPIKLHRGLTAEVTVVVSAAE
jgi:large subunit ribosomal protein L9